MREADAAISPSGPLSQGSPLPGDLAVLFFPDWRVCGQRLAQDISRPGVPKTLISRPISAMTAWAAMIPQPVISSSRATAGSTAASGSLPASGPVVPLASMPQAAGIWAISSLARARQLVDLPGQGVDLAQDHAGQLGVVVLELPVQGLGELLALGAHLADGQVRPTRGPMAKRT